MGGVRAGLVQRKTPGPGGRRQTPPAETGMTNEQQEALFWGSTPVEGITRASNTLQVRKPVCAGTHQGRISQNGGANTTAGNTPTVPPGRKIGVKAQVVRAGFVPRENEGEQLVLASQPRGDADESGQITPESGQSKWSSPSVELSPYMSMVRGHSTPLGCAVSARRH